MSDITDIDIALAALTPKQRAFCIAYVSNGFNGSKAARDAGYSDSGDDVEACRLLGKASIQSVLKPLIADKLRLLGVDKGSVLSKLAAIAAADIGDVIEWGKDGVSIRASKDISDRARYAVSEVSETRNGNERKVKVKQHDKVSALKLLGQHLDLWDDQPAAQININTGSAKDKLIERLARLQGEEDALEVDKAQSTQDDNQGTL